MGDFHAQRLSIFWPLAAVLFCVVVCPIATATDAHEGMLRESLSGPPEASEEIGPEPEGSGSYIGNVPLQKKANDYNLKNLKPEDYPLEFLIPFMKVSQVFKKKVEAKESPSVTSQMDRKDETPKATQPNRFPEKWTALPPNAPERSPRTIETRGLASVEEPSHVVEKNELSKPKNVVVTRPVVGPTRQLLESFKASQ